MSGSPHFDHQNNSNAGWTADSQVLRPESCTFQHQFSTRIELEGEAAYGRFGFSLAAAGDLNGDGFGDFLVGAPYDGPTRRGAVYVFHGKEGGIRTKAAQVGREAEISSDNRRRASLD